MSQVSLKDVVKVYPGGVEAVHKVNLGIESREFMVLVGPSGCGKTTVLRMIAGLEDITGGEIFIGNKLVNNVPAKDRDIAMVFQNYALYPHMSVFENMAFGLKLRKYPKHEIVQRVKDAASILGIEKFLERKPKELSGGQKQRVAVGRAIVRKPLVFLFDEPLSNLDAKFRVQMRQEIHKLHNRLDATMIYVTHDQMEAMTLGDRMAVMRDGNILQVADPLTVYDKPANKFVAGFIGSPPMNFMNGKIVKVNSKLYFDEGKFKVKIADEMVSKVEKYVNKEVIFGIRAEDIYDKLFAAISSPENTISVIVEVVEPMGSEVYLYLNSGKHNFIARVGGHEKASVNQKIDLVLDMKKIHFFDKDTEETIV